MPRIILAGYMGAGKTSVGLNLSDRISVPFYDLDHLISNEENLSIADIFKTKGEIWFRKKEHEILHHFIRNTEHFILSLGGGTPCYANNHLVLQQEDITSFYLKSGVSTLVKRLSAETHKRPLLQNIDDLHSFVGQHLFERVYFYNFCKHTINCDNLEINEISSEIIKILT